MSLMPPDPRAPGEPGGTYPPTKPDNKDTAPLYYTTRDQRDILTAEDEVAVPLLNGCIIVSGWIDKDDPDARLAGQYLRLEDPNGDELLYYEYSEWMDAPECYEAIGAFICRSAGFVGRMGGVEPRQLTFSDTGCPVFTVNEKIHALRYTLYHEQSEDALGHLFDMIYHVASHFLGVDWSDVSMAELHRVYGSNPTPILSPREQHDASE